VSDKAADAKVADMTKSCHIEKMSAKSAAAAGKLNKMDKGKGKAESSKGKGEGKGKDKGKGKMPAAGRQSFKLLLRPATMKKKRSHVGGQQVCVVATLVKAYFNLLKILVTLSCPLELNIGIRIRFFL
jgi:hypothetical protein